MKKAIRFCAAALAAAAVFLSACSARTPISADDFQKKAEALGYTVAADASNSAGAQSYLSAVKSGTDTQISFLLFPDESAAQEQYETMKGDIAEESSPGSVDTATYNKYVAQKGELYYTVVRMDDTVLYCKGTVAKKDEIDGFVSAIKY